jgi:hypothetical protein
MGPANRLQPVLYALKIGRRRHLVGDSADRRADSGGSTLTAP